MIFRVLSVADGEAIAATIWYEDQQPGLADEFLVQMHQAYESIRWLATARILCWSARDSAMPDAAFQVCRNLLVPPR